MAAKGLSPNDARKVQNYIRDAGTSSEMMKMAVKSIGLRMTNMAIKNAKKPEDKLVPTNIKSKTHQLYFDQALKEQNSPLTARIIREPKKRKADPPKKKGNKKKKKGRGFKKEAAESKTEDAAKPTCKSDSVKSPERPDKYDWKKVPKGLKSVDNLPNEQKTLLEKQFEKEGIEYNLD